MVAAARRAAVTPGSAGGDAPPYVVDVPGGRLTVAQRPDGHVELTGPAVLVAAGTVDAAWLAGA
jgi:diaminopimelate epimerase